MRVWMSPKYSNTNQYNKLLSDAIESLGINVLHFRWRDTLKLQKNDILHLHWISGFYQSKHLLIFIFKSILMIVLMSILKIKRIKIIWTIHNLYPHNYRYKKLERLIRKIVIEFSTKIIVAGEFIKDEVINEYNVDGDKIQVVYHGHYNNVYKPQGLNIRKKYGISENDYLYLFVGAIKKYKGVDKLIEAFNSMNEKSASLVIAGKSYVDNEELKKLIKSSNIYLDFNFIPDEEMADYLHAANAIILPYNEITTSGSGILALSYKRPIVAPKSSFFIEYFNKDTAVLYKESGDIKELATAMKKVRNLKNRDSSFDELLEKLDWKGLAAQIVSYCYR